MSRNTRGKSYLPPYLEVPTIANLPLDQVCVIDQYGLTIYPTPDGQEVYVDGKTRTHPARLIRRGRVGIMRCVGWDGTLGLVADLRHAPDALEFEFIEDKTIPDEVLSGDVSFDEWRRARQEFPIAAHASITPEGTRAIDGDEDFHAATAQLTELMDEWVHLSHLHERQPASYRRARLYAHIVTMGELLSGV